MATNRRRFLSLLGVGAAAGPLAAKAVADHEIGSLAGLNRAHSPLASTGLGLYGGEAGQPAAMQSTSSGLTYQQTLIGASDYIKMWGLPEVFELELRDQSKWISSLDPDLACKKSWSMSVKILEQRQRNYERAVERLKKVGWQQKKRSAIKTVLGFDWPW
jgi:hypothetical protein